MTNARHLAISAAALLLVAGGGCAGDGNDPAAPELSTAGTPSSTPPNSSPPTESEAAATAATGIVRRYFAVVDRLGQEPAAPLRELKSVATSIQLSAQTNLLNGQRRDGLRQTGDTRIDDSKVQSINLDNMRPTNRKVPTVTIDVCWDVSGVDVVDRAGKSTVSPSRPETGRTRYTVANYQWAKHPDDGWRVASGQDLERLPCKAS